MTETWAERYNHYFFDRMDHRFKGFIFMESPLPLALLIIGYVVFVQWFGPWWMKNRPPYNVEKPMLLYNIVQMAINSNFLYLAMTKIWLPGESSMICFKFKNEPNAIDDLLIRNMNLFFLSRLLDFLDTVFMVLKKNNHQVTFLHVYHHLLVVTGGWFVLKYYAGEIVVVFGTINALVHTIMYFYYFLTAYDASYKKSIWWKKQITQIQMVQFVIVLLQQVLAVFTPSCFYPKPLLAFIMSQAIFMMYLFGKFYLRSYIQRDKSKQS